MAMQHEWGVMRPVGGMGEFAGTLARIGASYGVTFLTGRPVKTLQVDRGRVTGERWSALSEQKITFY